MNMVEAPGAFAASSKYCPSHLPAFRPGQYPFDRNSLEGANYLAKRSTDFWRVKLRRMFTSLGRFE